MEKVFTLKLDLSLFARIRAKAHERGISIAALIREALEKHLSD